MARKKFRMGHTNRREPETERSFFEHMFTRDNHQTLDRREVLDLVRGGEDSEVEFKSRFSNPEKIAAEIVALANTGGGAILFGVSDTCRIEGLDNADRVEEELREVCAHDIIPPIHPYMDKVSFDNGRRVLVLEVDDRRAPHTTRDQKFYIRVGSVKREAELDEIPELFRRYRPTHFEQIPWFPASIDDIDESLVWAYVKAVQGDTGKLPAGYPTAMVLQDMQLAITRADEYIPNLIGLLLFGKSKSVVRLFPRSRLVATRFSGDAVTDPIVEQVAFTGNIGTLSEYAEGFLNRYVDLTDQPLYRKSASHQGPTSHRRANYSRKAVMEAVTNALVHRDYSAREECIRLVVFDRRIEVANPAFAKGLPRKAVELYGVSFPTNPRLKAFMKNEAYGATVHHGGLPMIRREMHHFTRREPKISIHAAEFQVEIFGA